MCIWFVVQIGQHAFTYRYSFIGTETHSMIALQKKLFRENGTPVLAVIRPKLHFCEEE